MTTNTEHRRRETDKFGEWIQQAALDDANKVIAKQKETIEKLRAALGEKEYNKSGGMCSTFEVMEAASLVADLKIANKRIAELEKALSRAISFIVNDVIIATNDFDFADILQDTLFLLPPADKQGE